MNRSALEHIVRAAAAIANEREIVVIGSQAILGQFPNAPLDLLGSIEADVYPRHAPQKSGLIDGAIGELSAFHHEFGYYAHGVDETTAVLPEEWEERLVHIQNENTGGAVALCLEVHDLAIAKLVAGRARDVEFVRVLVRERMVDAALLHARLGMVKGHEDRVAAARPRLARLTSSV